MDAWLAGCRDEGMRGGAMEGSHGVRDGYMDDGCLYVCVCVCAYVCVDACMCSARVSVSVCTCVCVFL